jgi:hypothetical protein
VGDVVAVIITTMTSHASGYNISINRHLQYNNSKKPIAINTTTVTETTPSPQAPAITTTTMKAETTTLPCFQKPEGVNFINILSTPFLYKSILRSFSLVTVWL